MIHGSCGKEPAGACFCEFCESGVSQCNERLWFDPRTGPVRVVGGTAFVTVQGVIVQISSSCSMKLLCGSTSYGADECYICYVFQQSTEESSCVFCPGRGLNRTTTFSHGLPEQWVEAGHR